MNPTLPKILWPIRYNVNIEVNENDDYQKDPTILTKTEKYMKV